MKNLLAGNLPILNLFYNNNEQDGTYTVDLNASEPGLHTVEVEWDGQPIPGSPFLVRIMQAPDMKKVRAYGPGLDSGVFGMCSLNLLILSGIHYHLCAKNQI